MWCANSVYWIMAHLASYSQADILRTHILPESFSIWIDTGAPDTTLWSSMWLFDIANHLPKYPPNSIYTRRTEKKLLVVNIQTHPYLNNSYAVSNPQYWWERVHPIWAPVARCGWTCATTPCWWRHWGLRETRRSVLGSRKYTNENKILGIMKQIAEASCFEVDFLWHQWGPHGKRARIWKKSKYVFITLFPIRKK